MQKFFHRLKKPWLAKTLAIGFAAIYLSASLQAGTWVQVFFHHHEEEQEATVGMACALHKCACKNAQQCTLHCCCKRKAAPEVTPEPIDPIESGTARMAQCSGPSEDPAFLNLRLAPHVASLAPTPPRPRVLAILPVREDAPLLRPSDPLLKVPILPLA